MDSSDWLDHLLEIDSPRKKDHDGRTLNRRSSLPCPEADGRDGVALAAVRELRSTLLSLASAAQAAEAQALRLSGDDGENEGLAHVLRLVLPNHPDCTAELAAALAEAGQGDLAGAIRSLTPAAP